MRIYTIPTIIVLTLGPSQILSQTNPNVEQGIHAFGSYDATSVDSVSLANGGLSINLPLFSYPERGGFGISINLNVTGKQWKVQQICNPTDMLPCHVTWVGNNTVQPPLPAFGPSIIIDDGLPHPSVRVITQKDEDTGKPYITDIYYSAVNADGAVHQIGPNGANQTDPGAGYSLDGSGIALTDYQTHSGPSGSYMSADGIITRKGVVVLDNYSTKDANGNIGEDQGRTIDTLGRSGIYGAIYNAATISDGSGCSGTLAIQQILLLSFPGPNEGPSGSSRKIKLCLVSLTLNTKFATQIQDDNGNTDTVGEATAMQTNVIQSIILYNGASWSTSPTWTFEFNNNVGGQNPDGSYIENYGDLTKVILPTGGSISYSWTTRGPACAQDTLAPVSRWVTRRTVNANSSDPNQVSTYTYDDGVFPSYIQTTTATDAQGNYTQHTFADLGGSGCNKIETKTVWHSLDGGTDKIVKTSATDYSVVSPVGFVGDGTAVNLNLLPIRKTITLPSGLVSKTETDYDSSISLFGVNFSRGTISQVREYDYGVGAPGSLIRCTQYSYKAFEDSRYLTANLLDLPTSRSIYSGACGVGTLVSKIIYGYDESSVQSSGVTTQLDTSVASPGVRGNQTSASTWINTSNGTVNTTSTYYDTGMPYSSTDGNGKTTFYSYSQAYAGAYLTQTTMPPTGSVAHKISGTYDFNTGSLTSYTDENSNMSTYSYDALARAYAVSYPDGGGITLSYPNFQTVGETRMLDVGRSATATTIFDGMGRVVQYVSPGGAKTDTRYNSAGRVASVSNPYSSVSDPTYGITSFAYDVLGRKTIQTQQDNSKLQWCYDGVPTTGQTNCHSNVSLDQADESGNDWQQINDALGRLVSVVEPGNLSTIYTYSVLDDLTYINQKGNGTTDLPRTRSFTYDSLSRLVQSYNPESGWICYGTTGGSAPNGSNCTPTYDANGNLLAKTNALGITTTYAYDALNRLADKTFSDGQTPGQHFRYDQASSGMGAQTNTIGRLSEAYTEQDLRYLGSGSPPACNAQNSATANYNPANGNPTYCTWTDEVYSYDTMGRPIRIGTASPSEAGWAAHGTSIQYDLTGSIKSMTYPDGRNITQAFDGAEHLQTVSFDNWNGTHVGYNYLSSATYLPDGSPKTLSFGNGTSQVFAKNNRLQPTQTELFAGASGLNQPVVARDYQYTYDMLCADATSWNRGNIVTVHDELNSDRSQYFCYDNLNRLTLFENEEASLYQGYSYDAFGNIKQSGTLNFVPSYGANNQINSGGYTYDATGSLKQINNGVFTTTYSLDAESKMFTSSAGGYYTYDASGERVRKDVDGGFTEYQYLNGQPIAEKDSSGNWTDYIYANGQKIVMAPTTDSHIHVQADGGAGGYWQWYDTSALHGYVIRTGDKLSWRQYQSPGARGGMLVETTNGGDTAWNNVDQNGNLSNQDSITGQWDHRTVNLSNLAGNQITLLAVGLDSGTTGSSTIDFADIALLSTDGTVQTIYNGQAIGLAPWSGNNSMANAQTSFSTVPETGDKLTVESRYYTGDQVGTTRVESSDGGWPTWAGIFYPFGQQADNQATTNHYKFTGKERDAESGNDYFDARYYGSTMGRFLSPDPMGPWVADVNDPQSWNFYTYARNNPLVNIDPTGLDCINFNNNGAILGLLSMNPNKTITQQATDCGNKGGNWVNGTIRTIGPANSAGAFSVISSDVNGTYTTTMAAPGKQADGTACLGNCISDYTFTPAPGYIPQQDIAPSSQEFIQRIAQQTAPVVKAGNCAGAAALAFSSVPTPDDAADISGFLRDQSVDTSRELAEKGAEKLAKFGGAVGKGAKLAGKVLPYAKYGYGAYKAEQNASKAGCFSGWSHP